MSNTLAPIPVVVGDLAVNLQPFQVKGKSTHWFCLAHRDGEGQIRADVRGALAPLTELPTEVVIDGTPVETTIGRTKTGNPKVTASKTVTREGATMTVQFQVSHTERGSYWLLAKAFRQAGHSVRDLL